jgi:pimeloyl-ACP methyl ester carboxylesterase
MWRKGLNSKTRTGLVVAIVLAAGVGLAGTATVIGTALTERAHPATGRFVPVTGGLLHVVEKTPPAGVPEGPAVVLIHGAAANLHDLENALGERLSQRHRVLLIDRPGHGWSPANAGPGASTTHGEAALLHEALQLMGANSAVLVGHSWGGALAAAYALDYPQNLAGLILLAPVVYPWTGGLPWFYQLGAMPVLGPAFAHLFAFPVARLLTPSAVQRAFSPQAPPPDYLKNSAALLSLRPRDFLATAREVAGLKTFGAGQTGRYAAIAVPTVIIAGDRDAIVQPQVHARALAAALPQAKLMLLPGIGHMPHYAAADLVSEAVAEMAGATSRR